MCTGHAHAPEPEESALSATASCASVALDVGPGRGALVLYPAERFRGREIEISRTGEEHRVHTGVHDRLAASGARLTAIFGSLAPGEYVIWEDAATSAGTATVRERAVAEVQMR
jgi:hypothetical protein